MNPITQGIDSHIGFKDWTREREVATIGTNTGSIALAFQDWRHFKEAFAPELIELAVSETKGRVAAIVDPFGGSGTTALAAQFLGIKPTTIEVNPYLADLIEAKIATIDLDAAAAAFGRVVERAAEAKAHSAGIFPGAPATFVEPGVKGRFLFSRLVAERITAYREAIADEASADIRRLFTVVLASATVPASNVVVSGKGRRYRRGWQKRLIDPATIDDWFRDGVLRALYDLRLYGDRACIDYTLLRGDARERVAELPDHDLAVFSPPYPNSFDYTDVYNVELWTMGYLDGKAANLALRNSTLRSHVQIHRDMAATGIQSGLLSETVRRLENVAGHLWNKNIPAMVAAYTADMATVLRGIAARMRPAGRTYMVVGDSRYAGIDVPVAAILAQISPGIGFEVVRVEPCRSMRASPQQGGRAELAESLVVLERR
ncbi:MAG: hypothetical protein WC729_09315 [Sphingomonas sp.]|uniref:hypothetical protein n=1 Tax=Sphingomonas sp. TaxID=28214 RepID=UPI00356AD2CC